MAAIVLSFVTLMVESNMNLCLHVIVIPISLCDFPQLTL